VLSPARLRESGPPGEGRRARAAAGLILAAALAAGRATAEEPRSILGDRLRLGGEVSGTLAPDDEGYFNYSDYETNTLRLLRLDVAAEIRLARAASIVGDVRVENFESVRVYALYLRLHPWSRHEVDLQAGLVPPVFGAWPRRHYASENPLPSVPLAYQYLSTLRADAVPSRTEDLVVRRGSGWRVRYPVGSPDPATGVPVMNGERWDAGVEMSAAHGPLALSAAVTQGSLSHPRVRDDNDGKQLSGRLAWSPGPWLVVGVSGASGEFLDRAVQAAFADRAVGTWRQEAAGFDLEWSRGRWIARVEGLWARWHLPALDPTRIDEPLDALGGYAEGRFKIRPGLYAAGRVERMSFDRVASDLGRATWDAPVTRYEAGAGWSPRRRVTFKLAWQHDERDGGRVRRQNLVAGQVVLWF
jgi:hypothetical protein